MFFQNEHDNFSTLQSKRIDDRCPRRIRPPYSWERMLRFVFQSQYASETIGQGNLSWYTHQSCSIFVRDWQNFSNCKKGHHRARPCWTICLWVWIFPSFRDGITLTLNKQSNASTDGNHGHEKVVDVIPKIDFFKKLPHGETGLSQFLKNPYAYYKGSPEIISR